MELKIHMQHGIANDICLVIPKEELKDCMLSMPGWKELNDSSGYLRHCSQDMPTGFEEKADVRRSYDPRRKQWVPTDHGIKRYKIPPLVHLGKKIKFDASDQDEVAVPGLDLLDEYGRPTNRLILIGNRNLGNNLGFIAWHKTKDPKCFHLQNEQITERVYSCLTCKKPSKGLNSSVDLSIDRIKFQQNEGNCKPVQSSGSQDIADEVMWCTYGQQVLRKGQLVDVEELIDQFYDIRHVFFFPTPWHQKELSSMYKDYPRSFRDNALHELRSGRPRSRYLHNAVGIGSGNIVLLQRHGTIEEIGQWLQEAGAEDGLILDNGGSVFTWAWWPLRDIIKVGENKLRITGNVIFNAPDWRPQSISLIAFALKGQPRYEEPGGAVAMAMV
jgi:hypothetical protein